VILHSSVLENIMGFVGHRLEIDFMAFVTLYIPQMVMNTDIRKETEI